MSVESECSDINISFTEQRSMKYYPAIFHANECDIGPRYIVLQLIRVYIHIVTTQALFSYNNTLS